MASYKTRAIIINRLNLGESDRILTLFSADLGKIRAICKGARKTKSKFSGHTELFSLADFVISTGKSLDVVNDVTLVRSYFTESPDMSKIKSAYYFAEIVNKLLPDHAKNPEIYELYLYSLELLDRESETFVQLVFVSRILKTLGIYPELNHCVKCEKKPDKDRLYFSKNGGGLIDSACSLHFEDADAVDEDTIKLWRYIADAPLAQVDLVKASPETIVAAADLASSYIHCVTMIDYKSLRILS